MFTPLQSDCLGHVLHQHDKLPYFFHYGYTVNKALDATIGRPSSQWVTSVQKP
jgi:hypothetical protein